MKIFSADEWEMAGQLSGGSDINGYIHVIEYKPIKIKKKIFIQIENNGLKVPFEVEDFYRKHEKLYVKLFLFPIKNLSEWKIESVWVEKKYLTKNKSNTLIGRKIVDVQTNSILGEIIHEHEFSGNQVLEIKTSSGTKLIPIHADFVQRITKDAVYVFLPEGMKDL